MLCIAWAAEARKFTNFVQLSNSLSLFVTWCLQGPKFHFANNTQIIQIRKNGESFHCGHRKTEEGGFKKENIFRLSPPIRTHYTYLLPPNRI